MERFVTAVIASGGMVNKFTGDGFLAVFGVPVPQEPTQSASQAIRCAACLQQVVQELEKTLRQQGSPELRLRVGLHSGEVIAGSMGSSERMEFAVIGDVVNVCARLEALEKERMPPVAVFCSPIKPKNFFPSAAGESAVLGLMPVKGRSQPVAVYELELSSQRTGN